MAILALLVLGVVVAPTVLAGGNDTCYGSLGCFSNKWPWSEPLRMLPPPQSPEIIDTRFYLYTRKALNRFTIRHPSDGVWDATGSDFLGCRKTVFVIHGLEKSGNATFINTMKDSLLVRDDVNVIIVDWGKGAAGIINYLQVSSNTRVVAASIAQLFKYLKSQYGAHESRIHFVGHSLGAHISGYVGKAIPNIARITALDVAHPLFENHDPQVRLDKTDAVYVDAIHTHGNPLLPIATGGFIGPVGHADFFVNGGWNQPGCLTTLWPNVTSLADFVTQPVTAINDMMSCPHDRSVYLFIATLNVQNCTFWGHQLSGFGRSLSSFSGGVFSKIFTGPCTNTTCSAMGYNAVHYPARGSFDVTTSGVSPFCITEPEADGIMTSAYAA